MHNKTLAQFMIAATLSTAACDRKNETAPAVEPADEPAVTSTTLGVVGTIPAEAGADGGEAGVTVVGVSVTTIAVRGNPGVVEGIANARCEREQRCGNIGADKGHLSLDACRNKIAMDWKDDLNRYECPGGIVQRELDECLQEIRNEDCNNPFDKLERVIACRVSDICISSR
jgi:hypothetical protein